jgi:hypothetical protein
MRVPITATTSRGCPDGMAGTVAWAPPGIPCAGYLVHLFQKRALMMAEPFFFFTMYASVGDVKVSCRMCFLPDF